MYWWTARSTRGSAQCSMAQAAREWVTSQVTRLFKTTLPALGFCDRASWANCGVREKTNKMQQLLTVASCWFSLSLHNLPYQRLIELFGYLAVCSRPGIIYVIKYCESIYFKFESTSLDSRKMSAIAPEYRLLVIVLNLSRQVIWHSIICWRWMRVEIRVTVNHTLYMTWWWQMDL